MKLNFYHGYTTINTAKDRAFSRIVYTLYRQCLPERLSFLKRRSRHACDSIYKFAYFQR